MDFQRSYTTLGVCGYGEIADDRTGRMSTLPRITPRSTPALPSPGAQPMEARFMVHASLPSAYELYPPRLPSAPDIPGRVNPLKPNPPQKRTVMLETINPHHKNDQRALRMKQREHYRYHNSWSKYYYGSAAEKESHRAYQRTVLKQQMTDKWATDRQQLVDKVRESEDAVEKDRQVRHEDAKDYQRRYEYLKTFRDDNKKLMENHWDVRRSSKLNEDKFDREQLRYNPINWSCSLK